MVGVLSRYRQEGFANGAVGGGGGGRGKERAIVIMIGHDVQRVGPILWGEAKSISFSSHNNSSSLEATIVLQSVLGNR